MTLVPDVPEKLRALSWEGCLNARDTGGYPTEAGRVTRYGALLRADNLCRLSEAGRAAVAASGIRTIIDVRSAYELQIDPSPFVASDALRYLNLPLQDEDDAAAMAQINADITLQDMYRVMLRHFGANIAAITEAIAASDAAVVVHCHAGKDRTGVVIALVLAAVGTKAEAIAADYAASSHYLGEARRAALLAAAKPEERAGLTERLSAADSTMLSVLAWLEAEYGGARPYLLAAGVSAASLEQLHHRLVA